jgi:transcriptional regulator with XRE-family HTH domain
MFFGRSDGIDGVRGRSSETLRPEKFTEPLRCYEASPSVETAKKIADILDVTLDYLVDESASPSFDKKTVQRLQKIQELDNQEQDHIYALMDAFLRDARARRAYAS